MSTLLGSLRRARALSMLTSLAMLAPLLTLAHHARADLSTGTTDTTTAIGRTELASNGIAVPQASGQAWGQQLASVDPVSGAARMTYPFELPPARGTISVNLALDYASNGGDGNAAGVGWSLNLPYIERRSAGHTSVPTFHDVDPSVAGVNWNSADTFYYVGQPLVPICKFDGGTCAATGAAANGEQFPIALSNTVTSLEGWFYFRLPVDDGSALRFFLSPDRRTWVVQGKKETREFGAPLDGNWGVGLDFNDTPVPSTDVYRWNLVRRYDHARVKYTPTNPIVYVWSQSPGHGRQWLTDIYDTPNAAFGYNTLAADDFAHHVILEWSTNTLRHEHAPSWRRSQNMRLDAVVVTSKGMDGSGNRQLVRRYNLRYSDPSTISHHITLLGITPEGRCAAPVDEANVDTVHCNTLPELSMEYSPSAIPDVLPNGITFLTEATEPDPDFRIQPPAIADLNADGLPDLLPDVWIAPPDNACSDGQCVANNDKQHQYVFLNRNGTSSFTASIDVPPSAQTVAPDDNEKWISPLYTIVGDWFGDGRVNLLATQKPPWKRVASEHDSLNSSDDPSALGIGFYSLQALSAAPRIADFHAPSSFAWKGGLTGFYNFRYPNDHDSIGTALCTPADINGDGLVDCWTYQKKWKGHYQTDAFTYVDEGAAFSVRDRTGSITPPWGDYTAPGTLVTTPIPVQGYTTSSLTKSLTDQYLARAATRAQNGFSTFSLPYFFADMDGDGINDLVTPHPDKVDYYRGHGNGWFGDGVCSLDASSQVQCDYANAQPVSLARSHTVDPDACEHYFHDVNGDGLADMIFQQDDGLHVVFNIDGVAWTWGDDRVLRPGVQITEWPPLSASEEGPNTQRRRLVTFADMNGSGVDDIVIAMEHLEWNGDTPTNRSWIVSYVDVMSGAAPSLLTSIHNGYGATQTLTYSSTALLPFNDLFNTSSSHVSQVTQVVTDSTTTNGLVGPNATNARTHYDYSNPVYDARERQFRGFRSVRSTVGSVSNGVFNGDYTVDTRYLISECPVSAAQPCAEGADNVYEALRGLPVRAEIFDVTGRVFYSTDHTQYAVRRLYTGADGRIVRLVYPEQFDSYKYDTAGEFTGFFVDSTVADVDAADDAKLQTGAVLILHSNDGLAHLQKTQYLDNYGNLTLAVDYGRVNKTAESEPDTPITTQWVYSAPLGVGQSNWLPQSQTVFLGTPQNPAPTSTWSQPRQRSYLYDNDTGVRTDVFGVLSGSVALNRFHEDPSKRVAPAPTTRSQDGVIQLYHARPDSFGNVTHYEVPGQQCADINYDDDFKQLPLHTIAYAGKANGTGCGQTSLDTILTFDRGFAMPTTVSGVSNSMSATTYDEFGRVKEVYDADPEWPGSVFSLPSKKFEYPPPQNGVRLVHVQTLASASGVTLPPSGEYFDSWRITDGLGQVLADLTQDSQPGSWIVSGRSVVLPNGLKKWKFVPTTWSGVPASFPVQINPTQVGEWYEFDAFGRATVRHAVDGQSVLGSMTYHALSEDVYDGEDLVAGVHANTPMTVVRDGFGRISYTKSRAKLPNGTLDETTTRATYLATNELTRIERAHSAGSERFVRTMLFDSLGRMVESFEPNTSPNPSLPSWIYSYDDAGRLVGTSDARGCGKNVVYDAGGRMLGEDYSPCLKSQIDYTDPNWDTGDGTEVFYRYDSPESGSTLTPVESAAATGRLTAAFDRGSHSRMTYDGNGRTVRFERQITAPGAPATSLSGRYANSWYTVETGYDASGRVVKQSTGADAPELLVNNQSAVTMGYARNGRLAAVDSSYGLLVGGINYDADGTIREVHYADRAHTLASYDYNWLLELSEYRVSRSNGPWATSGGTYTAPDPGSPATVGIIEDDVFSYDLAGNPTSIADARAPSDWGPGAQPISKRQIAYDDNYRVTGVPYDSGNDSFASPLSGVNGAVPTVATARVLGESFTYDWLGNTTLSASNPMAFFDRGIGQATYSASAPNQLLESHYSQNSAVFVQYDTGGNTGAVVVQRPGTAWCSDPAGKCTQRFDYDWDEVGRLVRARRWDFAGVYPSSTPTYPAKPVTPPSADVSYAYDASNTRILKSVDDGSGLTGNHPIHTAEVFGSLQLDQVAWNAAAQDYDHPAGTETLHLPMGGRVFYAEQDLPTLSSGRLHVFIAFGDTRGSSSAVIDRDTGELVERSTYLAYGAPDTDYRVDRWLGYRDAYRFSGHEDDTEVGLTYFGQRYYSTGLGRWLSPDPAAIHNLSADLNPYAYVRGRVTSARDAIGFREDTEWHWDSDPNEAFGGVWHRFIDVRTDEFDFREGPGAGAQECRAHSCHTGYPGGQIDGIPTNPLETPTGRAVVDSIVGVVAGADHFVRLGGRSGLDTSGEYSEDNPRKDPEQIAWEQRWSKWLQGPPADPNGAEVYDKASRVLVIASFMSGRGGALMADAKSIAAAQTVARPAWILPGALPAEEEAALLQTLQHIDNGTQPVGPLATKWNTEFRNKVGDLPGAKNALPSPYTEFRVAPGPGVTNGGVRRIVVDNVTGDMFYTWTHYGTAGDPPFVQIR